MKKGHVENMADQSLQDETSESENSDSDLGKRLSVHAAMEKLQSRSDELFQHRENIRKKMLGLFGAG